MIRPEPVGPRSADLAFEKPHRYEWMDVDEREAPVLRCEPDEGCDKKRERKCPRPITLWPLFTSQVKQRRDPEDESSIPYGRRRRPTIFTPKPVSARKIQCQISGGQNDHAADPDRVVKPRASPTQGHSRYKVAKLHHIVNARKKKDRGDRRRKRESSNCNGRNCARRDEGRHKNKGARHLESCGANLLHLFVARWALFRVRDDQPDPVTFAGFEFYLSGPETIVVNGLRKHLARNGTSVRRRADISVNDRCR